jgi:excisionase family DNA binding protein
MKKAPKSKGKKTGTKAKAAPKVNGGNGRPGELIDMQEAIKLLKTTRPTFYRWLRAGKVRGMKVGRQWRFYREDIERFLKGEEPRIDLPADITPLIKTLSQRVREVGLHEPSSAGLTDGERAVALMTLLGTGMGASDFTITAHVPPAGTEPVVVLRYRVDGVFHEVATIDNRLLAPIIEHWKRIAACDVREKSRPQDGRFRINLSRGNPANPDKVIDVRVNFLPSALGESLTGRLLDRSVVLLNIESLGFATRDRDCIMRYLKSPSGLMVVAGPTGAGKTTTLYASLNEIAGPDVKVVTVEDPVEFLLPWTTQIPVNPGAGVTFESALRSILRSAPNTIMIGEIRSREALEIAQQASLTGHLVMTTLHTQNAVSTFKRMIDIGSAPFLVADTTRLLVAQRLIRLLCPHCSAKKNPTPEQLKFATETARQGGLSLDVARSNFKEPVGCPKCNHTGYRGRTLVVEVLEVTPEIGEAIRRAASVEELTEIAVDQGMTTMAADGIRRAAEGETTLSEVMRVVGGGR